MAIAVRAQLLQVELLLAASKPDDEPDPAPAASTPAEADPEPAPDPAVEAECSADDEAVEFEPFVAPPPIPGQVQLGF